MATLVQKIEAYVGRKVEFFSEVTVANNGDGDFISEWNIPDIVKPNESQLDDFAEEAEELARISRIQSLRASEYPSYADQFDTIFHEGLDAWKAQIQAVKDKYPKGATE